MKNSTVYLKYLNTRSRPVSGVITPCTARNSPVTNSAACAMNPAVRKFLDSYRQLGMLCCFSYPEGVPAAFINYYHLRDINALFVEHFASAEELRGKGVGSAVMNSLLEQSGDSLVVLEVEPPEDELSRRRVQLYRRLGFTLNDGSYFQPPFYGNPKPLPLMLMSTRPLSASEFASTAASIHRNVYKA